MVKKKSVYPLCFEKTAFCKEPHMTYANYVSFYNLQLANHRPFQSPFLPHRLPGDQWK